MKNTIPRAMRQQGAMLVEILVAMMLGMFLMVGLLQIFLANKQTYMVTEAMARLQENGRFAIEFLARDARMADFWGCASRRVQENTAQLTNNLANGTGFIDFNAGGVNATDGTPLEPDSPDSLTLRGGASLVGLPLLAPSTPAGNLTVTAGNHLEPGDLLLVSDCTNADIFQATNDPATGSIEHIIGAGSPGNVRQALSKSYDVDAQVYEVQQVIYTVDDNAAGEPTLFRQINNDTNEALIEGVEDLQILYGEDTDSDGAANYYVPLGDIMDIDNVIGIRVFITVRSSDNMAVGDQTHSYDGSTDRRLRQTFMTTISLRNRLG